MIKTLWKIDSYPQNQILILVNCCPPVIKHWCIAYICIIQALGIDYIHATGIQPSCIHEQGQPRDNIFRCASAHIGIICEYMREYLHLQHFPASEWSSLPLCTFTFMDTVSFPAPTPVSQSVSRTLKNQLKMKNSQFHLPTATSAQCSE